ncbi:MAG: Gfo/Idh/MocA family oxidoreductase [Bifidobacteriaceae bacterium]|jgi:predicted dehydrogenase|nr:Gfo/Idh/MocA family oxidoreductase [Bifidobacteriaceae bacterium]
MATIQDPMAAPVLRWGVIGAGGIADTVITNLQAATRQELVAVGARSAERAQAFADKFGAARAYGSYEELVADDQVQVVYVATTHNTHYPAAKLALEAGKHVLMEKAFTVNQREAAELAELAAARGLFLMEAMWTRFLPHMVELRERVAAGVIGDPLYFSADFGFRNEFDPDTRFYSPELGGGALLDRGIYPISAAVSLFGLPEAVVSAATLAPSGVDAQFCAILDYPSKGAQAVVESALNVTTPQAALLAGSAGMVKLPAPFWAPTALEIAVEGKEPEVWRYQTVGRGYEYQIAEVARRVAAGETESPVMPVAETVAIMGLMDTIRAQCGITLPGD